MKTQKTIRTSLSLRGAKVFRVWYKHRSVAKTTVRPRLGNAVNGDGDHATPDPYRRVRVIALKLLLVPLSPKTPPPIEPQGRSKNNPPSSQ